jgi:hypothetical protein
MDSMQGDEDSMNEDAPETDDDITMKESDADQTSISLDAKASEKTSQDEKDRLILQLQQRLKTTERCLAAEYQARVRLEEAGAPESKVVIRAMALAAVHHTRVLPAQQLLDRQAELDSRRKVKIRRKETQFDIGQAEGCSLQDIFHTRAGLAMNAHGIQLLTERQEKQQENKRLKSDRQVQAAAKHDQDMQQAKQIADPLIDEFLSGRRELDAKRLSARAPAGLTNIQLSALSKVLKIKRGNRNKARTVEALVKLLTDKKARLESEAKAHALYRVDDSKLAENLRLLRHQQSATRDSMRLRKAAMMCSANFILCSLRLDIYGGFVRDALVRDDWHCEVDLDVSAAEPQEAAQNFTMWLQSLGVSHEQKSKGRHVTQVQVNTDEGTFEVSQT